MDLSAFRTRYPEFSSASDGLVTATLADAALRVDDDAFGTSYDMAHGLMAAHLLWASPFGSGMRLDGDTEADSSRYLVEFRRLTREKVQTVYAW